MNPESSGPFDKDTIESKAPAADQPLSEKDFIQESPSLGSRAFPLWLWIFLATALVAMVWGSMGWYQGVVQHEKKAEPFLDVTNRQFSVFLWQFPSFLRSNVSKKAGYLPGFQTAKETLELGEADAIVTAPPDLLFLYHTWHRLLVPEQVVRSIKPIEFIEFLNQVEEWQPKNWPTAPQDYVKLMESKQFEQMNDLQSLPESSLPVLVRQAFLGWKNYYREGAEINALNPSIAQVQAFLEAHPHYKRNYWRNIQEIAGQQILNDDYLYLLTQRAFNPEESFPANQLAPFLKVALFNAEQAEKETREPARGSQQEPLQDDGLNNR
ncbi:conserved putative membrane protein [Candidatus Protochlamydia naegleriophila]|uniref:Conserved putative membrane protein n=1 Tax=Candidatus Protochlamydia naegleriophila TaxID=389348 RepID=A0A0U5ESW7_9BACT|nr:hypothetical protein [Candidatus Protochlamydia naegleriophila]CUI17344.1 conserved putative membrane protein [Candidatus Protochlamydia naegleriophila]